MKIELQRLLPADLPNETAFQLVQFFRGLAFALETIYFDNLLLRTSEGEYNPFPVEEDENGDPF